MPLAVIGAGFDRTGTMSLKLALEQLELRPCFHMVEVFENPKAPGYWEAAADRLGRGLRWLCLGRRLAGRHVLPRTRRGLSKR